MIYPSISRDHAKRLILNLDVLKAFAEGKEIQHGEPRSGWTGGEAFSFNGDPDTYRVKPQVLRTKRFLWRSAGGSLVVCIVTYEEQKREPREDWHNFIRWIDAEWHEVEVPAGGLSV